ncbi:MAG: hypothetical protein ABW252_02155 [Polyangiales bacterium]
MHSTISRVVLACLLGLAGCGDDDATSATGDGGLDASTGDGGLDATTTSPSDGSIAADSAIVPSDAGSPFPRNDAGQVLCGTSVCRCSNGVDEDADGLIDADDPECVSPWDDDEATFGTGISGDNRDDACQDCFFDGNSGSGNDGCRIPSSCLTLGNASSGSGSCNTCAASTQCQNFCEAYTPNGCDCFGCCAVQLGSNVVRNVLLGTGCNIDGNDVSNCTSCVPSTTCVNTCGRCELCPGKTLADLPADCAGTGGSADAGTPVPSCEEGTPCGAGLPPCSDGAACTYGCCVFVPVI